MSTPLSTRTPPPSASHILNLPMELLLLMSSHLSIQELSRLTRTTKHLHSALILTVCRRGLARGAVHVSRGGRRHQGCLPLVHWAVMHNHARLLANVLAAGGSAHEVVCSGMTPLHLTTGLATIRLLAAHGVDVDEPDHLGQTLLWKHLMLAPKHHYCLDTAEALIAQLGADVNQRDAAGNSLLHHVLGPAYKFSHRSALRVLEMLLAHGADAGARNKCGLPPLASLRLRQGHKKAIALLLAHGADVNHLLGRVEDALREALEHYEKWLYYGRIPPFRSDSKEKVRMIKWLLRMGLRFQNNGWEDACWGFLQQVAREAIV